MTKTGQGIGDVISHYSRITQEGTADCEKVEASYNRRRCLREMCETGGPTKIDGVNCEEQERCGRAHPSIRRRRRRHNGIAFYCPTANGSLSAPMATRHPSIPVQSRKIHLEPLENVQGCERKRAKSSSPLSSFHYKLYLSK